MVFLLRGRGQRLTSNISGAGKANIVLHFPQRSEFFSGSQTTSFINC